MPANLKSSFPARIAALGAFTLLLAFAGCKSAPAPDDNTVNSAVQAKIAADTALAGESIQSLTQDGVVILQGTVSSEAAKALAASDASQVPGAKSVVNQLAVQTAATVPPATPISPVAAAPPPPIRPRTTKPGVPSSRGPIAQGGVKLPKATQQARNEPPPPPSQPAPIERRTPEPPPTPAPPPPAFRMVTIPAGTTLPIRITQTIDSATAQPGDAFSGSTTRDIVIDGLAAIPAGTNVGGRVDEVHEAGHFKGSSLLTISLVNFRQGGNRIGISTEPYTAEGKGRGTNTAAKVGAGAAIGAILGGILGGGKGAAIGAGAGGGLGAGAQAITRGQQVQINSETLLNFRLTTPIELRVSTTRQPVGDANPQLHPRN
jgi:hypothetical protein